MPRAPQYEPQSFGVQPMEARLRPADNGGGVAGGVAAGLQNLGEAAAHYADAQDRLNARNDDTQARKLFADAQIEVSGLATEFRDLEGGKARAGQADYDQRLEALKSKYLSEADNPRQRMMLEERLAPALGSARTSIAAHALQQSRVERAASFKAEEAAYSQAAAATNNPEQRDLLLNQALGVRYQSLADEGFDQKEHPEMYAMARLDVASDIHRQVLDKMFASPDPNVNEIAHYLQAYSDEMTVGLRNATLERLKAPLQARLTKSDANFVGEQLAHDAVTSGHGPIIAPSQTGWQGVAVNVAHRFGLDPADVAAVMSYETAGTFSPTIMGGKGGQYMGLIQFGAAERAKYGIDAKSSPAQWTKAIESFLSDRGFKAGMGLRDLYSTINAGSPGHYSASDGNGTVDSHVQQIITDHRAKAIAWLDKSGSSYDNAPREWDRSQVYDTIDKVAKQQGWSPERTDRVREEWDRRINRDEGLLNEQYRQASDEATRIIAGMPDGLQSITQLPQSVRDRMDPTDVAKLQQGIREQQKRAAAQKESLVNTQTKLQLEIMKRLEPEKFNNVNLLDYTGKLSPADLTSMFIDQQQARMKPVTTDDYRGGINSAISWGKKYEGVDVADKDFPAVFDTMHAYLAGLKRPPTQEDYSAAFRHAVTGVASEKTFLGIPVGESSVPLYKVSDVPPNFRAQFTKNWRGGGKPTDAQVLSGYRMWLDRQRGALR